jgi:RND family efflux transporter MFP subunit
MHYQRLAVACALATSLALAGCGGKGGQRGTPPLNVDAATAQRQSIATYLNLDGQIAPLEQSSLSFQQTGAISRIDVNIGDLVQPGQLLAQIDPSVLQAQYEQAAATAQGARIGLPVAQQNNAASLQTAKAALDNARLVYNQDAQLFKQGYVSQQQLESARAAYVQSQSQYNSASANIANNQVTAQNVKASEAQANVYSSELAQTSLYAPYEGVITSRSMDPGSMAGPQAIVLGIARVDVVWVNVNVPDEDLAFVRVGSPVTFTTSSIAGKTFSGRIDNVNAVPTAGTLSYLARLRQPNPGAVLRGGMLVNVTILQARHDNAIVVPRSALSQTDSGTSVYIVTNAPANAQASPAPGGKPQLIAKEVPVKVGLQTDTMSEVISPQIGAGTQVITTRPDALQDGSPIAISTGGSPAPAPSASGK